jgi:hypothetical protein
MRLTLKYDSIKEAKADEDLRLKGLAFDRLNDYFKRIIRDEGASGILAVIPGSNRMKKEALVYELAEHFRKQLNSVYKDELENS